MRRAFGVAALLVVTPAASAAEEVLPEAPSKAGSMAAVADQQAPIEIVVQGPSDAERLRDSARAVSVLELDEAQEQSADLGELLARTSGIGVRRAGGLGSATRLSLNGLSDEQVRVFLDGVPLDLAGYSFGLANVPVGLIERVDIYRGVVPIRFGADALGGAIDLVTDDRLEGTHGAASYQVGSFGTHRLAAGVRTMDERIGFFTRAHVFYDRAKNDYPVTVEWPNSLGRPEPVEVRRFHDAYQATGVNVEAGLANQPWARRLAFRTFFTDELKELQHGVAMTIPFGDAESRRTTFGVTGRYQHTLARRLRLDLLAGYTLSQTRFVDPESCLYDWWGNCLREPALPDPTDYLLTTKNALSRMNVDWHLAPRQVLRASIAPTFSTVMSDERAGADPNDGDQKELWTLVSGVEHETSFFDGKLQNILFVKAYLQAVGADKHVGTTVLSRDRDTLTPGLGDSLRFWITEWLYAKASYEYATRLPNLREIFGDGVLVLPNLEIVPETSHNVNLGARAETEHKIGVSVLEGNVFWRDAEQLILLLQSQDLSQFDNVFGARAQGIEIMASWTSPGDYLMLGGNATYLDFRNTSEEGVFAPFSGDRIPNRPYFFANGNARVRVPGVVSAGDSISLLWTTRYVHEFFRSWESIGARDQKDVIPEQLVHSLALVYEVRTPYFTVSNAFEIQNITDAAVYDYFGVQRPGRALYFKTTAQF